jgi:hypothetical protein
MNNSLSIIEQALETIIDLEDITVSATRGELGILAQSGELLSEEVDGDIERVLIQCYVKCIMATKPSDETLGFTNSDITTQSGVILADVAHATNPPQYVGEAIDAAAFMEQFITDIKIHADMTTLFEKLESSAYPTDGWLDQINTLYSNRVIGEKWITNEIVYC